LALAQSLESLHDLGAQLDRMDASLKRSSGGAVTQKMQVVTSGDHAPGWSGAEAVQSSLEGTLACRPGADGEWFRRILAKRREVLYACREGDSMMRQMKQNATWMLERQRARGVGDEIELIAPPQHAVSYLQLPNLSQGWLRG
jgi:hypothetical protein